MVHALLNVLLAYLVGSVPFGLLVGFMKGVDVRIAGSGNIGATNIGRLLGRPWGIVVFLLDLAKGLAGVGLGVFGAIALSDGWRDLGPTAGGLAAFLGPIFPVYLRFTGGKGVATGAGVALGLIPTFCLEALGIWLVVTLSTRMVSAGSLASASWLAGRSLTDLFTHPGHPAAWFGIAASFFVILKHRSNFSRILAGTENRLRSGWIFEKLPGALHLIVLGGWISLACFVTFVAGLGLFDRFNNLARLEASQRPYWLMVPSAMQRESPGKSAGLPEPLWQEQGGILAGNAVSVLFGPYFYTQVAFGLIVLATSFHFFGKGKLPGVRACFASAALFCALAGVFVEREVENLRLNRYEATEQFLKTALAKPEAETPQAREELRLVRANFGKWHGVSVALNLATLGLVVVLAFLAVPVISVAQSAAVTTVLPGKKEDETEVNLVALPKNKESGPLSG